MPRSKNIDTYTLSERKLLSKAFLATLPQTLHSFPSRAQAMAARLTIYGLIGAGKRSHDEEEFQGALRLSLTSPARSASTGPSASESWEFTLYDRRASAGGATPFLAQIESLTAGIEHTLPAPGAPHILALEQFHIPELTPMSMSTELADMLKNAGYGPKIVDKE